MPAQLKFREILEILIRHEIEFVVVGGVAAILEGAPISTFDLDVVYNPSKENNSRLARALTSINARYKDLAGRIFLPSEERLGTMKVHLLETDLGPLDILKSVGDNLAYEEALRSSFLRQSLEMKTQRADEIRGN